MKTVVALLFLSFSFDVLSSDLCQLENLKDLDGENIECLYYAGTKYYREKNYEKAALNWEAIIAIKGTSTEYQSLVIDSNNNLGFLYYFGMGVKKDELKAIEFWKGSVSMGHEESEYHLCHAYGEKRNTFYNPHLSSLHCKKAKSIYEVIENKDEDDAEILRQINLYLIAVESVINA